MSDHPIIDETALNRNRKRALAMHIDGADFLLQRTAEDIALRLSTVKRHFDLAVDLNSSGNAIKTALEVESMIKTLFSTRSVGFEGQGPFSAVMADDMIAFGNARLDLVVSALTLQFVNDLPGLLIQIRRTLKPDGLFMASMVGSGSLSELKQSFLKAEVEITGAAHARILPFVDVRDAGGLLQRAGFALPVSDVDRLTVRYDTPLGLMHDLRAMGAVNCLTERSKTFLRRDVFMKTMENYARDYSDADGRIRATFEIISLSGWAPHESQQKPLAPGSATVNLKDVLGR